MAEQKTTIAPVRERILGTAIRLFRSQGYGETGINQILREAEAARASFYLHFPAKEDLGRAYIQSYGHGQLGLLAQLMKRYPNPADFIKAWARILKREAKAVGLHGCAMANLRAQTPADQTELHKEIRGLAAQTIKVIEDYLNECQTGGRIPRELTVQTTARRLFVAYEGSMQTWQLTGQLAALEDFVDIGRQLMGVR